jgi:predicted transport protein
LIALKVTAYKIGEEYALTFVKVLDEMSLGLVDEDEPIAETTDRTFWETKRGTKNTLQTTDSLLALVKELEPRALLKYNKHYIGIEVDGSARNFVSFMPRKAHIIMTIKLPKTVENDEVLEESGLETLRYESQWRQYRLRIDSAIDDKQKATMLGLVKQAIENFGKGA